MMYLSRITLTRASLEQIHRLRRKDGDFWEHRMVWNLFDNAPDQQRDFLYRREDPTGERPFYYLLSARMPTRNLLGADIQTREYEPALQAGAHLAFGLRANAVVTRKVDDHSKRRHRLGIIDAKIDEYEAKYTNRKDWPPPAVIHQEAAEQWMKRQGERYGFHLDTLRVSNHQYHKIRKPGDHNLRQFTSLDLDGLLTVKDPAAFHNALFHGLGRSKAFGCGLLLVRRA
jgi:CRISPR system Cascade subunit CasE